MTAYLSQSLLFATIFLALPALTGMELHLGEARAAGIGCGGLAGDGRPVRGARTWRSRRSLRDAAAHRRRRSERKRATAAPPTARPDDA